MYKYIVTWIIVFEIVGQCPDPPIQYDDFGRIKQRDYVEMSACISYDTTEKEKVFDSKKDAIEFIQKGSDKKAAGILPLRHGELSQFKLDSVPKIQYECMHNQGISVTGMNCIDLPCNTATCLRCGKKWLTY